MKTFQRKKIGILLFEDACPMDFIGPYEAFSVLNYGQTSPRFDIFTISQTQENIHTFDLQIAANYTYTNCPQPDILIIPGGDTPRMLENQPLISWLKEQHLKAKILFSVCNGALLLAKAGLLKDMTATTHHAFFNNLQALDASIKIQKEARFVDNEHILTSAGISAGIDAALYLIKKIEGEEAWLQASTILEYGSGWKRQQLK